MSKVLILRTVASQILILFLFRKEVQAPGPAPQEDQGHQEGSLHSREVPEDRKDPPQNALVPREEVCHQGLKMYSFECPIKPLVKI